MFGKWWRIACRLYLWFEKHQARRALNSMPDHILKDVGITRADLLAIDAWDRAEHERRHCNGHRD